MSRLTDVVLGNRLSGRAASATTVLRWLIGSAYVAISIEKFAQHDNLIADFVTYGLPASSLLVYLIGGLELVGGLMLLFGIGTRLAALALAADMVAAIATAGVNVGGPIHLVVTPILLVVLLFLLWAGPGPLSVDQRLAARLANS